jgi:hypothetical protein
LRALALAACGVIELASSISAASKGGNLDIWIGIRFFESKEAPEFVPSYFHYLFLELGKVAIRVSTLFNINGG